MKSELLQAIENRQARIAVVGLGYVGLPLLRAFSSAGFPSHGLDIDPEKIDALMSGQSYIKHIHDDEIASHVESGKMTAGTDFSGARKADAILICVPTPLGEAREPDLKFIEATAHALVPHLKAGQLIVLESTTYPGTTEDILTPILAQSGLDPENDLFIAYSPEREDPGNPEFVTGNTPKIVSGLTPGALEVAKALYSAITDKIIPVSSMATAEAAKLTENVFRAVNIALVNELKIVYEKLGIDVWEVIDAAATKPFGFMPFYPGPGLGGHCIPIDPFYLSWVARAEGISTRFIELAGEINRDMPEYVMAKTVDALNRQAGLALSRAKVLLLGLAYKKNVDDLRESPALRIWQLLEDAGAEVAYFDPHIPIIPKTREYGFLTGKHSITWSPDVPSHFDCCIIVTDHDDFDYLAIAEHARLIIDTRNALRRAGHETSTIVRA